MTSRAVRRSAKACGQGGRVGLVSWLHGKECLDGQMMIECVEAANAVPEGLLAPPRQQTSSHEHNLLKLASLSLRS